VVEPYLAVVKQDCRALSSMEAKYVACYLDTQKAIWLKSLLQDLSLTHRVDNPIKLMYDNIAVI